MTKIYLPLYLLLFIISQPSKSQITYHDITDSLGLYHTYPLGFYSGGVAFYDFDGDGWDDLSLASPGGDSLKFYKNMGGSFQQVSLLQTDPLEESKQILWADYDNDGDKDLFVTHFLAENKLYQNDGNMNFTDVTAAAGLVTPDRATYGACFGDYDKDGWLDLYVVNYSLGLSNPIPQRNFLFRNVGDGTFEETTLTAGVAAVSYTHLTLPTSVIV